MMYLRICILYLRNRNISFKYFLERCYVEFSWCPGEVAREAKRWETRQICFPPLPLICLTKYQFYKYGNFSHKFARRSWLQYYLGGSAKISKSYILPMDSPVLLYNRYLRKEAQQKCDMCCDHNKVEITYCQIAQQPAWQCFSLGCTDPESSHPFLEVEVKKIGTLQELPSLQILYMAWIYV